MPFVASDYPTYQAPRNQMWSHLPLDRYGFAGQFVWIVYDNRGPVIQRVRINADLSVDVLSEGAFTEATSNSGDRANIGWLGNDRALIIESGEPFSDNFFYFTVVDLSGPTASFGSRISVGYGAGVSAAYPVRGEAVVSIGGSTYCLFLTIPSDDWGIAPDGLANVEVQVADMSVSHVATDTLAVSGLGVSRTTVGAEDGTGLALLASYVGSTPGGAAALHLRSIQRGATLSVSDEVVTNGFDGVALDGSNGIASVPAGDRFILVEFDPDAVTVTTDPQQNTLHDEGGILVRQNGRHWLFMIEGSNGVAVYESVDATMPAVPDLDHRTGVAVGQIPASFGWSGRSGFVGSTELDYLGVATFYWTPDPDPVPELKGRPMGQFVRFQ